MLESVVNVFAHAFVVDVHLDAATRWAKRCVLQRGKAGLAHHALEHHAARDADGDGQRLQIFFGFAVVQGKQRLSAVRGLDVIREGDP